MNDTTQLLTWVRNGQSYGLPLERCREVKEGARLFHVPLSRSYVAGVCNLRGDVVTVIDLPLFMREQEPNGTSSAAADGPGAGARAKAGPASGITIVRIKHQEHNIAILADRLTDILEVDPGLLESPPRSFSDLQMSVMENVLKGQESLVRIVRPEGLFGIRPEHGQGSEQAHTPLGDGRPKTAEQAAQ